MTSGRVADTRKPFVPVIVLDSNSNPHSIQFILDTGFTGQLLLPNRYMEFVWACRSQNGLMQGRRPVTLREYLTPKPRLSGEEPGDKQKSFS